MKNDRVTAMRDCKEMKACFLLGNGEKGGVRGEAGQGGIGMRRPKV